MSKKHNKKLKSEDVNETNAPDESGQENVTVESAAGASDDAETVEEVSEPEETDPIKILEQKVEKAEDDSKAAHERLLRATAEFDNYKKRSLRETSEFRKFANESLIKEILPVVDNLERAIESSGNDDSANKSIVEGVEMTLKEIFKVLEKFNLKPLDSEGKAFDPNFHQAVLQEETDEHPENTVLKEMQKGYVLHDRLIRPAMVVVSKAKVKNDDDQNSVKESADHIDE